MFKQWLIDIRIALMLLFSDPAQMMPKLQLCYNHLKRWVSSLFQMIRSIEVIETEGGFYIQRSKSEINPRSGDSPSK